MSQLKRYLLIALLIFTSFAFVAPTTAIAASPATIKIVKLTSPVKRNAKAKLVIQTAPGAKCHLIYRTPSGTVSTAKGLGAKVADKKGLCTWNWKIGSTTKPGNGQLIITANNLTLRKPIVIK